MELYQYTTFNHFYMMENIESRMLQTTITKGNNKECEVRQELYRKHQIRKKAQQDVGLFYGPNFLIQCLGYIGFRLLSRSMTTIVGT